MNKETKTIERCGYTLIVDNKTYSFKIGSEKWKIKTVRNNIFSTFKFAVISPGGCTITHAPTIEEAIGQAEAWSRERNL